MHMWRLRMIAAAILVLVVSGCGRPNPLIGNWKLALAPKDKMAACKALVGLEFTEKTVTTSPTGIPSTVTVTYGRDGDRYLVTEVNGTAFRFKVENDGIEANGCHLVPASAKSNPLLGKWKPVDQGEACRGLQKLEFTEDTMTMKLTDQARREEQDASGKASTAVTYSRDGEYYVATPANGPGDFKFKVEISGIKMFAPQDGQECLLFPAD